MSIYAGASIAHRAPTSVWLYVHACVNACVPVGRREKVTRTEPWDRGGGADGFEAGEDESSQSMADYFRNQTVEIKQTASKERDEASQQENQTEVIKDVEDERDRFVCLPEWSQPTQTLRQHVLDEGNLTRDLFIT